MNQPTPNMDKTSSSPTRADVLREYTPPAKMTAQPSSLVVQTVIRKPDVNALADEIVRLRAERAAMIRRVEKLERHDGDLIHEHGASVDRAAVLAALRDGGTDD